jgi:hypothetical protein
MTDLRLQDRERLVDGITEVAVPGRDHLAAVECDFQVRYREDDLDLHGVGVGPISLNEPRDGFIGPLEVVGPASHSSLRRARARQEPESA